ncbi:hypothetical protein BO71DRAFT_79859 [Aspergillus ellipticus CBS 707.79]|uniref:Fibroin-3 related protein n=1 Tax=Aspergillus ellipticus CBS 707.79 TaxID=1448320 RepID=A0A319DGY2_9EURO|nr:hypothetical protein BO71DRAFT_79859 [Aspergillus ellipticus CBS 707.79]
MSPALDKTTYPLWARDVVSDLKSDVETFSSWDKCMSKAYCKWPVIAAIIIAALILLSIIACIVNCLCCGIQCCKGCCGCCSMCCPTPRNKRNKTKHLDDPYQQTPMPAMPPPAPINNAYHTPYQAQAPPSYRGAEVARFDNPKSPANANFNEDSLPAMPTWDNAVAKRVEDTATYEDVEMKPLSVANNEPRRRPSAATSNVSGYSGPPPLRTVTPGVPSRTGTPGMPTRTGTPGMSTRTGTPGMPQPQRTGTPGMPLRAVTPGMPQRIGTPGMPQRMGTPASYPPEHGEFNGHDAYGHDTYAHDTFALDTYGHDAYGHDAYGYQPEPRSPPPISPYDHQPYGEYPHDDRFHNISPAPTYTTQPQQPRYMAAQPHHMPMDDDEPHYAMDPMQPHHMPMDAMQSHYPPMDAPQSHYMPMDHMQPQQMPSEAMYGGHQMPQMPIDRTYSPGPAFHSMNAPRPIPYRQPSPAISSAPPYRNASPATPTSPPPPFSATTAPHETNDPGRPPSLLQSGRRPAPNF